MNRVFVDLDGVLVDFDGYKTSTGLTGDQIKALEGAYLAMAPLPGGIEGVRSLIGMGYDVRIATKPPTGVAHACSDKAQWVIEHIPELKRRIIITHDKGLLGDAGDVLIDDRPHKANCEKFAGTLVRFVDGMTWADVLTRLARPSRTRCIPPAARGQERTPLTKAERRALTTARDHGHAFALAGVQRLIGGAYRRMCLRLSQRGLLTREFPLAITDAGRAMLTTKEDAHG